MCLNNYSWIHNASEAKYSFQIIDIKFRTSFEFRVINILSESEMRILHVSFWILNRNNNNKSSWNIDWKHMLAFSHLILGVYGAYKAIEVVLGYDIMTWSIGKKHRLPLNYKQCLFPFRNEKTIQIWKVCMCRAQCSEVWEKQEEPYENV